MLLPVIVPGDVVIHMFLPQQRAFYNLEEFYGNTHSSSCHLKPDHHFAVES
ncbi:hypothetical protein ES319_A01G035900v1 [Gossypium barbadense]|uniref:Uncharacterized protein n=2 Tax=Gossypium TaxID=3633 RepID=A0A5J5WT00_GOSBA|nr:hypothetical protein ES319_A01G035900v1 [Gossypium barbadense]TYH29766.1 hypothetical protein ES288_A01G037900v1 [Gossypium darwinii]